MADPSQAFGGLLNTAPGQLLSSDDMTKVGGMANMTLLHTLAMLFFDAGRAQPKDGFIGDGGKLVAGGSPLEMVVKAGVGFQWIGTFLDPFQPDYKPVVIPIDQVEVFTRPGTSTHSRIDVVSVEASEVQDQSGVRVVKDVTTGVIAPASVNTRRLWSSTATITPGTASTSPAAPSAPAGHLVLGEVLVPSSSSGGPLVLSDLRPKIFGLGSNFENDPGADYAGDFIPGTSTELSVGPDVGLATAVVEGDAVINGQRSRYGAQVLGMAAAPTGALHRWDTVYASHDGTLGVSRGVDSITSIKLPGVVPANAIGLSQYNVGSGATAPTNFEDLRVREPYNGDRLREGTVTAGKLSDPDSYMHVAPTGTTGVNSVDLFFQVKDSTGNNVARAQQFLVELMSDTFGTPAHTMTVAVVGGKGTINNTGNDKHLVTTDVDGLATLQVSHSGGSVINLLLRVEPVIQNNADRFRGAVTIDSLAV